MTTIDDAVAKDLELPDIDWHIFPPGTVRDRFRAPSGELARVRLGSADARRVVLVPGAAGSKEDFVRVFPLLAEAGYAVESYDLAGHWESAGAGPAHLDPPRETYDFDLFVDDLLAILDADPRPAHVLGYSFGALVAQLALVAQPERFRSLTLMSAPPATGQVFRGVKHIGPLSDMSAQRASGLILWGIRYNFNRMPAQRIAFVRERMEVSLRSCFDDIIGLMMAMPDIVADVAAVDIPKLVVFGEHDLWPREQHAAYANRIGGDLVQHPSGHAPCETSPHQLARDMLRLFARA